MWVPVAVWQPCELLYTCFLLTYLRSDQHRLAQVRSRASAGFWLGGQCPLAAWGEKKLKIWLRNGAFWSISDLNKHVVSIAPFSTPAFTPTPTPIQKTALFYTFSLFNFSSIFQRVTDPICPSVRTPMISFAAVLSVTNGTRKDYEFLPSFLCWSLCLCVRL